jgi:hypothetical protein
VCQRPFDPFIYHGRSINARLTLIRRARRSIGHIGWAARPTDNPDKNKRRTTRDLAHLGPRVSSCRNFPTDSPGKNKENKTTCVQQSAGKRQRRPNLVPKKLGRSHEGSWEGAMKEPGNLTKGTKVTTPLEQICRLSDTIMKEQKREARDAYKEQFTEIEAVESAF